MWPLALSEQAGLRAHHTHDFRQIDGLETELCGSIVGAGEQEHLFEEPAGSSRLFHNLGAKARRLSSVGVKSFAARVFRQSSDY